MFDDFVGRDEQLYFHAEEFAETWRVGNKAQCSKPPPAGAVTEPCAGNREERIRAETECERLMDAEFIACHHAVDIQPYFK